MTHTVPSLASIVGLENTPAPRDLPAQSRPQIVCDVGGHPQFSIGDYGEQLPFLHAFAGGPLHGYSMEGEWDLARAAAKYPETIFRSFRARHSDKGRNDWRKIIFQFGPQCFVCVNSNTAVSYDTTAQGAEAVLSAFDNEFRKAESKPSGGCFQLLKVDYAVACETVMLAPSAELSESDFALRYGPDGLEWHHSFVGRLRERDRGISFLEGAPGTGKTHYLRHLMSVLKDTHRFYFLPPTSLYTLSQPEFIEFWSRQRRVYQDLNFVVILEDCEEAIATRTGENNNLVSVILNLSDGMLSDFLKIQILCTVNCKAADIDQALLRPGRLTSHRVFPRLAHAEAQKLAESLGKELPQQDDYSLAEIFSEDFAPPVSRARMGFAG